MATLLHVLRVFLMGKPRRTQAPHPEDLESTPTPAVLMSRVISECPGGELQDNGLIAL